MADHAAHNLPATFKALQVTSADAPLAVTDLPTPIPSAGTVLLRPLFSNVVAYANEVFANGNPRMYPYPSPMVPGTNAICRVAATGPDTPRLKPGTLVYTSGVLRGRDDTGANSTAVLHGLFMGFTPESQALMQGEWRNGTWAELVKVPAENVHILDEDVLVGNLGYRIEDLGYLSTLAVPHGGLSDAGLKTGETVLVAPATGTFGSAAVQVALAMGAGKVIVAGRSQDKINKVLEVAGERAVGVVITGDVDADAAALGAQGPIDVYFDISPQVASAGPSTFTHIKSGIAALRPGGRMSMMGGVIGDVQMPYQFIMGKGLSIRGTFMYTREQMDSLIRLIETGMLTLGKKAGVETTGKFALGEWETAFEAAARDAGPGKATYFVPNAE
ncbi:GroES-like protein [Purpureocillium lavendulum]|uniref:GroES-like protein n=1 Tax=Purpureocillium lavendulum TaxID=1247861 RepID=A0AB34G228_9HYPO|nr:GroES-like protein [Purpureocillium lavendulum]